MTVRKKIIELLKIGTWTAKDISVSVHISEKDVLHHLDHIRKALKKSLCIKAAVCLSCGFVFSKRTKIKCPGKCPICRNEHIQEPSFFALNPPNS